MVSIPRVISNKTRVLGLSQSSLISASIFKPVPAQMDKIGKVIVPEPNMNTLCKFLQPFAVDSAVKVAYSPLKQPFSTPKRVLKIFNYQLFYQHRVMRIVQTKKFCVIQTNLDINWSDDYKTSNVSQQSGEGKHTATPIQPPADTMVNRMSIFLDIDEPYTRELIRKAFRHPSRAPYFQITLGPGVGLEPVSLPSHCHFQWSEYERIDWHNGVLPGHHGASSYCIRKGLSRKAQLAHYTHRHMCKNPNSILCEAIPQTVVLDTWPVWDDDDIVDTARAPKMTHQYGLADVVVSIGSMAHGGDSSTINRRSRLDTCLSEAKDVMLAAEAQYQVQSLHSSDDDTEPAPVWILKGSTTNKGAGIFIVHLYEQVVDHCWSESSIREWVLQRYISKPLLLRKRKFHIRAYVLAVSALRVYFYRNCLALCAGKRYRDDNHYTDLSAHITNTAFQVETDTNFQGKLCVLQWNENVIAPILVRDGTFASIDHASDAVRATINKMGAITGELFSAYKGEFGVFAPIDGCFEHYGLDFLVDDEWNVSLLEVNPGPDFKQTGHQLEELIEKLMGCTVDVALLPQVAPNLCTDQLEIGLLMQVYEQCRPPTLNG